MKLTFSLGQTMLALSVSGLVLFTLHVRAESQNEYAPAPGEFDTFGEAVVKLLKSCDAGTFATNMAVNAKDWQSIATTNLSVEAADKLKTFAKGSDYNLQRLKSDANAVLDRADKLHLDFSKDDLRHQITAPKKVTRIYWSNPNDGGLSLPYLEKLEVVIMRGDKSDSSANEGFKLSLRGLEKFPTGWRISNGIQWTAFPTKVADAKTRRELALLEKISAFKPITGEDDPSLLKLGESLVRFIREQDTAIVEKELLLTSDIVWAMFQKSGRKGPSRQEVDEEIGKQNQEQVAVARKFLKQMKDAGIDLKQVDVQVTEISVEHCQSQRGSGSTDELMGDQFKLRLAVKSSAKAKTGASLSGEYVVAAKQIMKMGDGWRIERDLHWERLPKGVVDAQTAAEIEFESYVAEHDTLPQGMTAPEIEFTALVDEKKMKLSDLRGKVVLLDFWATWCGPCQQPMADLQKIRKAHPDWQDKVAIIPLSIDDSMNIVRKHVNQRGWTNTFNAWAGDGGWRATAAKAFRVTGVPTTYVIDAKQKIVWAGHPNIKHISEIIDRQFRK